MTGVVAHLIDKEMGNKARPKGEMIKLKSQDENFIRKDVSAGGQRKCGRKPSTSTQQQ